MMEPTEEAIILSNSDEIALEDGEIEEEEVAEPIVEAVETVVCDELEVIESDNHNDSDVDACDRLTVKSKKHKHHKKSLHRKRQLSSDEISTSGSRKKQRSSDDLSENTVLPEENRSFLSDHEGSSAVEKVVEKCVWKHDSDNEDSINKMSPVFEEKRFIGDNDNPTQVHLNSRSRSNSPVIKEKWGNDSDEDSAKPSESKQSFGGSDWTNNNENKSSWVSKNEDDSQGNKSWNNKNDEKKGWGNTDDDNKGWGNRNDDNKGWGNRNENNKGWGGRNDDSWNNKSENNDWSNKNDDNKGWGNRDDGNRGWGNRNDDNNSGGYRRGGRNNWGNRNDDRNNRGFRNRGRGNWRNRNDDDFNGGNRNRGNDWGNRNNDNWGNKNNDNNDWSNKNNDSWGNKNNDSWGNKDKDKDDWGYKNKDNDECSNKGKSNDDWGNKNRNNDDWGNKGIENNDDDKPGSDNKDNFVSKIDNEVEEKQAWNHTSDDEDSVCKNPVKETCTNEIIPNAFGSLSKFDDGDDKEKTSTASSLPVKPRDIDDFGKWGGSDSEDDTKTKEAAPIMKQISCNNEVNTFDDNGDKGSPEVGSKWNAYDSDDEASTTKVSSFKPQKSFNDNDSNFNRNDSFDESGGNKWNSPAKNDREQSRPSFKKWGAGDNDDDTRDQHSDDGLNRGNYNNFGKRNFDNRGNRNDNYNRNDNNRNDNYNRNDNNRGRNNNSGPKKYPCRYFQMGTCHRGDNCGYIHESPTKNHSNEQKVQELCRFYEHQECYKRNACTYMHEEFPCKLFHAGSKMCPSGDSCKYSHAPLNPDTKAMLEKYLDEKIDERTDKSTSGSIHDNSDYKANTNVPPYDDLMSDPYFQDPMSRMYPQQVPQDPMKFPIRPWNSMMHYNDMPIPPPMEFMQRQRFMYDRYQQPMPGRVMQRGFRGMMPNVHPMGQMHDPYNGNPYSVTPLMSVYPKVLSDMKDPYIDNLAQIVVGKESYGPNKDAMKRDMMDQGMGADDEMNDYPLDNDCSKRSMPSPLKINSPEIPPGAYVPRTSMNAVQPNVRLGSGLPYGNEAAMMYGGGGGGGAYPGHPNESAAMMDYINMAAIHYYHNKPDAINYDLPWKLYILDVPVKIPYPLMNIDTQDLAHRYIDPRLKGHPSVLITSIGAGGGGVASYPASGGANVSMIGRYPSTEDQCAPVTPIAEYLSTSSIGSQLSSPLGSGGAPPGVPVVTDFDMERQLLGGNTTFQYRLSDQESPVFPISDEAFSFLGTDDVAKRVMDRSYLQDPRFKRKKAVSLTTTQQPGLHDYPGSGHTATDLME